MTDAPEQRTLPAPVIDPDDVQAIVPSLTPDEATLYASLATLALAAACWPNPIPPAPLPAPIEAAGLSIAVRLATAGEAAGGDGAAGPVVSESIGGYTYRLATPAALDQAMQLTEAEYKLLRPWLGQGTAYDISVGYTYAWPADWWQRNLDTIAVTEVPE